MSRHYREEYTPWSFVIPVSLAAMIGVLAADIVRLMAAGATVKVAMNEMAENLNDQTTPGHWPARPNARQLRKRATASRNARQLTGAPAGAKQCGATRPKPGKFELILSE